ncbi:MAG: ATP-binding protein [Minisyncoccus archaeiphilus]|uniref:ATP-binding protein n=1 Tax=Minisyncoccus archaeiphilus TaxID=3238481 RepID=UPI0009C8B730|nr:MAG: hypothetical protein BWY21_01035 [Parcubacteria group bacterium ADurb.Bin216]GMX59989.1 MAG: ATP-binding protein [Candidatus Parcubacteria bacterium]
MEKSKIKEYINDQISEIGFKSRAYVFDSHNQKRPERDIFLKLQSHFNLFLQGNDAFRWVVLTGLRGSGKTTAMYQLYNANKGVDGYFLCFAVDEVVRVLGSSISEIVMVFEEMIGRSISNLDKPLFLFLDEVQCDPNWGVTLKTIYDKTNKVFIFSTGSAALSINSNADIARRGIYEKVYPLSFSEFLKIKRNHLINSSLSREIINMIFNQTSAEEVYIRLKEKEELLESQYLGISRLDFENYLYYGSLPFMITLENESIIYNQIERSLERVINLDIAQMGCFSTEIVNKIPAILYAVADMDAFNLSTIATRFEISRPKVSEIFSSLEKTELLQKVYPYGSHFNQMTKKPSKYLFSSPAFRAMYFKMIGSTISEDNTRGKLLEDLVGMYLYRIMGDIPGASLAYDAVKGGADFIFRGIDGRVMVMEVGVHKRGYKQVVNSGSRIDADYGIVISEKGDIDYDKKSNSVRIPLKYFILM